MNQDYRVYIYFFLIAQIFVAFNNFTYGLVNGRKQNAVYALLTISGNIVAAFVAFYMIRYYGFWGAIVAIMSPTLCPSIPVFFYGIHNRFAKNLKFDSIKKDSKLLSRFSLMLLFSTACFPIVEMTIRNNLVYFAGMEAAGYWQAITKLSSAYLSFYSLFLSFYFVPIISPEQDGKKIIKEVKKIIVFISSLFFCMMFSFLCLKNIIIQLVFTKEFLAIGDLFLLQMIGDFFRVTGWVVGFIVVAKALTKLYIAGEIIQALMFIGLSSLALGKYSTGLQGVVVSYVTTCFLYCSLVLFCFYYFFCKKANKLVMG
jgi:O-antigen/teichoic acid export membrane protein